MHKYSCVGRYERAWWPQGNFEGFSFLKQNSSNYTEADTTKDWTQSILGIYTMELKTTMLIAWIGGGAVRVMESLSDDKIMSDIVEVHAVCFIRASVKLYTSMAPNLFRKLTRFGPSVASTYLASCNSKHKMK